MKTKTLAIYLVFGFVLLTAAAAVAGYTAGDGAKTREIFKYFSCVCLGFAMTPEPVNKKRSENFLRPVGFLAHLFQDF